MRILITGGAGFLGSGLVRFLAGRHPEYLIAALDTAEPAEALENIGEDIYNSTNFSFWQGDIRDKKLAGNLVRNSDAIVHFAAKTGTAESMREPGPFFETNVNGTLALLEAARESVPEKFIHISASSVYGISPSCPVTEEHPLLPCEPCGGSKAGADNLVHCFTSAFGIPSLIIRPFCVYGPFQHPRDYVPLFITQAIEGNPVPVPGDGSAAGDWLFVEDFCKALDSIIHLDFDKFSGEIINLGSGREKRFNEIAMLILKMLDKSQSLIKFVGNRPELPGRMVSSVSKMELLTGWEPLIDPERGLRKTVKWYLENQDWWRKRKS